MFRDDACIIDLLAFDWENDPQNDILEPEADRKGPPQSHNHTWDGLVEQYSVLNINQAPLSPRLITADVFVTS